MISIHVLAALERTHPSYIYRWPAMAFRAPGARWGQSSRHQRSGIGVSGDLWTLRGGVIESGMEPGGHLVAKHSPGPARAPARHGGAPLCSLKRRATRCPIGRFTCRAATPGGVEPNVIYFMKKFYQN
jgi:hypothetical protein